MRRTNANPFFFSRTTAKKKWRPFSLSVDLRWRKRHERHQQKHETTRRRTTHMIIIITLLLPHRQFLFLMLCFCLLCSFVLLQSSLCCLHQRATPPSRGIFSLACRPFGGHWTNDTKLNNTQLILFSEERHKRLSLSLCVFLLEQQQVVLVFLSAKSSSVLRRSSFVVKGKERLKNETLLESCVQTRMWIRRRSLDWVETEIRTWHQRQQTPEWDDVFRSKTDGTRRDLFTSLC